MGALQAQETELGRKKRGPEASREQGSPIAPSSPAGLRFS